MYHVDRKRTFVTKKNFKLEIKRVLNNIWTQWKNNDDIVFDENYDNRKVTMFVFAR